MYTLITALGYTIVYMFKNVLSYTRREKEKKELEGMQICFKRHELEAAHVIFADISLAKSLSHSHIL